jgi:hypothetical protein
VTVPPCLRCGGRVRLDAYGELCCVLCSREHEERPWRLVMPQVGQQPVFEAHASKIVPPKVLDPLRGVVNDSNKVPANMSPWRGRLVDNKGEKERRKHGPRA